MILLLYSIVVRELYLCAINLRDVGHTGHSHTETLTRKYTNTFPDRTRKTEEIFFLNLLVYFIFFSE